jgi:hypothetical protein
LPVFVLCKGILEVVFQLLFRPLSNQTFTLNHIGEILVSWLLAILDTTMDITQSIASIPMVLSPKILFALSSAHFSKVLATKQMATSWKSIIVGFSREVE